MDNQWVDFNNWKQIDEILANSDEQLVGIFKHSTRCSISTIVFKRFKGSIAQKRIKMYYLDLLNYRDISNQIATHFTIEHESPQLILLKDNEVVANASHYHILEIDIEQL